MKQLDKNKKTNIKCEHCEYFGLLNEGTAQTCRKTQEKKNYWNRCKEFEWSKRYE